MDLNFILFLKKIIINTNIGIIGLITVAGERVVPKKCLNKKLEMSRIGNRMKYAYNNFSKFIFFKILLLKKY